MRDRESYFIEKISKDSRKYIGDDGVLLGDYIVSSDSFFEDVHFKKSWMSLGKIAKKSLLVNISDAIAMNSTPKYMILNISIPEEFKLKDIDALVEGFLEVAKKYDIKIVGGDTIRGKKLDISITLLSTKRGKIVKRSGLKRGDIIFYTGSLGSCAKDLKRLISGENLKRSKMIEPILNPKFFYEASRFFSSAMDISDGLFFELQRLSKINRVGFRFFSSFDKRIGCSGEEYEVLFSIKRKDQNAIKRIARKNRVTLKRVAIALRGRFRSYCKPHHQ